MKLMLALVAVLLLWGSGVAFAQPVKDATSVDVYTGSDTYEHTHTVGAVSNTALLISVTYESASWSVSSMTVGAGASAMTQISRQCHDEGCMEVWGKAGVGTGAQPVDITLSASISITVLGISYSNADQTTPFPHSHADAYPASDAGHSGTTTSATDHLIADFFSISTDSGGLSVDAGQTTEIAATPETFYETLLTSKPGASPNVTTGYSWPNNFRRWAHVAVDVAGAAAVNSASFLTLLGCCN